MDSYNRANGQKGTRDVLLTSGGLRRVVPYHSSKVSNNILGPCGLLGRLAQQ